jgi:hypothetical protein
MDGLVAARGLCVNRIFVLTHRLDAPASTEQTGGANP